MIIDFLLFATLQSHELNQEAVCGRAFKGQGLYSKLPPHCVHLLRHVLIPFCIRFHLALPGSPPRFPIGHQDLVTLLDCLIFGPDAHT